MIFIWSFEELSRLSQHKKPIVREWAVNRLSIIYSEKAGDIAIRLVGDKVESVAAKAIDHFLKYPEERFKDALINLYKNSSGIIEERITGVLKNLGDRSLLGAFKEKYITVKEDDLLGYSLSIPDIAMFHTEESKEIVEGSLKSLLKLKDYTREIAGTIFTANLIAGIDIIKLVNFCYKQPDSFDLIVILLTEIGRYCGSWYSTDDIVEKGKRGFIKNKLPHMVEESLDYIGNNGYKDAKDKIERLFKKEKYAELMVEIYNETNLLVEKKKKEYGEPGLLLWQNGKGKPRQNIMAISAFKDTIEYSPESFRELIVKNSIDIFARVIEYESLIGLNIEGMDVDTALRVFLHERGEVEEDKWIMEILASANERDKIVELCIRHIKEHPDSWANPRIIRFLGDTKDVNTITRLLEIGPEHDGLWEEIVPAVKKSGISAVSIIKPILERFDEKRIGYALQVLEDILVDDSVEIILKYWDWLWDSDKEGLLEAIRGIGDKRFIEPLKKELREGELYETEIFYLLCLINSVIDPRLKKMEKELEDRDRRLHKGLEMLQEGDVQSLLKESLEVELRCRKCQRPYHYKVEKVAIDANSGDRFIMDEIKCKNCGVIDHYEITPKGILSITSYLMLLTLGDKADEKDRGKRTIVIGEVKPIDGKKMKMEEAIEHYEKKLREDPQNPLYLIGYANTLRTAKRTEDAIPQYELALGYDPLCVEAYVSAGQIAMNKGDLNTAYEYFKKASEIIHTGNYYKVSQDLDEFKEAVLDNFMDIAKKLGQKPAPSLSSGTEPRVKNLKVGRNAPCPCGSGRKYRKCCLPKELEQKAAQRPVVNPVEKQLTEKLIKYSQNNVSKKDFLNANGIYWRIKPVEPLVLPEKALEEKGGFIEWFVNDYILPSGKTIIEDFYSKTFNRLTDEEKAILESYMMSYQSIYEVQDVTEGVGLKIRDIFTGKELEIKEVKGSQQVVKWDLLMVRVHTLNGINRFVGNGEILPRSKKDGLMSFLKQEFEKFKQTAGKTEWSAFMKNKSYIVEHYLEDLPEERPAFLTEEMHELINARSNYDVKDFEKVIDILSNEYDFTIDRMVTGKEAKLIWLKRGESKDWKVSKERFKNGIVVDSKLMHESGKLDWAVLGNITITSNRLILECLSKERLDRGKQRLNKLLKACISHKVDTFEDFGKAMEKVKLTKDEKIETAPSETGTFLMEALLRKKFLGWLDERIPALNGITPREAIKTGEGRQRVIELIKDIENTEERKRKEGEPYLDVNILRKELGL